MKPEICPTFCQKCRSYEVIIVDGGSTDDTVQVARGLRPQARVIFQDGRGKGDALASGFAAAYGEIIVMLDADGSARVEEIPRFIDILLRGADFAKGSRFLDGGGRPTSASCAVRKTGCSARS